MHSMQCAFQAFIREDEWGLSFQIFPETLDNDQRLEGAGTWAKANGRDSILKFDTANLASDLEPLNKRLAEDVYGAGAWDIIKSA